MFGWRAKRWQTTNRVMIAGEVRCSLDDKAMKRKVPVGSAQGDPQDRI